MLHVNLILVNYMKQRLAGGARVWRARGSDDLFPLWPEEVG